MGKIKDLTGQRFGNLIVLEITPERKNRQVVWKCQCDCGNITYVVGQALRSGHTKSCGCSNKKSKNFIDISNEVFGKLTVIEKSESTKNKHSKWLCQCECGNKEVFLSNQLRNGEKIQCSSCEKQKPYNNYHDLTGQRFNKLIALEPTVERVNGKIVWKCQCDCGNIVYVSSNSLVSKNTQSCGCLNHSSLGELKIEQILKDNNIAFKKQYVLKNCLSPKGFPLKYDFALINENEECYKLIEFDGIQHFQPIEYFGGENYFSYLKECDKIKETIALQNNIPLQRISYKDIDSINLELLLC